MKNKGFTFAEILGVIVVISLLMILIVPNIINRLSANKQTAKDTVEKLVFNATDQYIKEHPNTYPTGKSGKYCISINQLINDGLLVEPIIDPTSGEDLKSKSVLATIYSVGTIDYDLKTTVNCEEEKALPMITFKVSPSSNSWVKERTVTIIYPSVSGNYTARHRLDKENWINDSSANTGGSIQIKVNKIATVEAQLKGTNIITGKQKIINVDSQAPQITNVTIGSWSNLKQSISIEAKDDISGLNGIYISSNNKTPPESDSGWINLSSNPKSIKKYTASYYYGTYYAWVKDKAGNISSVKTFSTKDTTKPYCQISDSGSKTNGWYTGNATLKLTVSDNESGVQTKGMSTSSSATYNGTTQMTLNWDTKSQTYYGFVKDKAGNTAVCSKTVKRDTISPSCSISQSGTQQNGWYTSNATFKISTFDNGSGVQTKGMSTSSSATYNGTTQMILNWDTKSQTYYGFVKDNAGHTAKCSSTAKRDTTPPYLCGGPTFGRNSDPSDISPYRINVYICDNLSGVLEPTSKTNHQTQYCFRNCNCPKFDKASVFVQEKISDQKLMISAGLSVYYVTHCDGVKFNWKFSDKAGNYMNYVPTDSPRSKFP